MIDQTNYAKSIKSKRLKAIKPESDLSKITRGKIQPQALELEQAVLGAVMLDRDAMPDIIDLLRPESLYLESHQIIYAAMQHLFNQAKTIQLLTINEEIFKIGRREEEA